jgi:hypothetical protein
VSKSVKYLFDKGSRPSLCINRCIRLSLLKSMHRVVVPAIDHKVNWGSMTLNKLGEDRRALQDVDVVVRSRHTKEGVPNLEIMGSHCLKYHSAAFL